MSDITIQQRLEKMRDGIPATPAYEYEHEVLGRAKDHITSLEQQLAAANARIEELSTTIDQRTHERIQQLESTIATLTERAERAEKLYEAAKPLADMMSLAAFRSNPRMSDGYCSPMGGVKEYELRHQASAIRDAVEKYDTARREAGRDKP